MVTSQITRSMFGIAAFLTVTVGAPAMLAAQDPTPQQPTLPQQAKFAWVNSQLVIQQTPGYAAAESTLNVEVEGFRLEVQQLQGQLDSMIRTYDQQEIVLTPSNRQAKQQEIRDMQTRLEQRYTELQTLAAERERELVAPIEERVRGVIEGIRAERNLSFVFDVASPGNNIIAADRTLNLTAMIVQRLNPPPQ